MAKRTASPFRFTDLLYQIGLGSFLSQDQGFDAESITQLALNTLGFVAVRRDWPIFSDALKICANDLQVRDSRLTQVLFGCNFSNPVGLAAGFDKNGVAAAIWNNFGFGFVELGTVTWYAQFGNPKPRLFRLAAEQAALNRMGFNNDGALAMIKTLQRQQLPPTGIRPFVIGLNLGKSRRVPVELAPDDYAMSLQHLAPLSDYVVINVSSPNTPGLRELQELDNLRQLIQRLKTLENCPPLLVKIAPDLENQAIEGIARLACEEKLAGIIAVNTSLDRFGLSKRILAQTGQTLEEEPGGLSGVPLRHRAVDVIRRLHSIGGSDLPLIGVGGIASPEAAWERIAAGASLVQLYTGWVFSGPGLVPRILEGFLTQMDQHGFKHISEVVGSGVPWK